MSMMHYEAKSAYSCPHIEYRKQTLQMHSIQVLTFQNCNDCFILSLYTFLHIALHACFLFVFTSHVRFLEVRVLTPEL